MHELRLYSPLTAELYDSEPPSDSIYMEDYDSEYSQPLDGRDLVYFRGVIEQAIEDETMPEEAERGLMAYYCYRNENSSVDAKVQSLRIEVEEKNDRLYGVAVCQVKGELTPDELAELKEFCVGQYADGWGEGFEQRERRCADGDLYVHFYQSEKFFICTQDEMTENRRQQQRQSQQKQRGGGAR